MSELERFIDARDELNKLGYSTNHEDQQKTLNKLIDNFGLEIIYDIFANIKHGEFMEAVSLTLKEKDNEDR